MLALCMENTAKGNVILSSFIIALNFFSFLRKITHNSDFSEMHLLRFVSLIVSQIYCSLRFLFNIGCVPKKHVVKFV